MPEFQAIGAACKRMRNILRQADEKKVNCAGGEIRVSADSADEEKNSGGLSEQTAPKVEEHRSKKEYLEALQLLSTARETGGHILRQSDGDGRRRTRASEPAGAAADVVEGIFHDRRFFGDRDRRERRRVSCRPSGTCSRDLLLYPSLSAEFAPELTANYD